VTRDQSFELTDESCVFTESEASVKKFLVRKDVEFVETHGLRPGPVMLGELLKR
jgi:hypothetical protein